MEDSPIIKKLMADRDKLLNKIHSLEVAVEKQRQKVYLLRERNFQLRKATANKKAGK